MTIPRISEQSRKTLVEFYQNHGPDDAGFDGGLAMLNLLNRLDEVVAGRPVWGLTSHYHLWLLAADNSASKWLVSIVGIGTEYHIEYAVPDEEAPWPRAYVRGTANDLSSALKMISVAMTRSGGWR